METIRQHSKVIPEKNLQAMENTEENILSFEDRLDRLESQIYFLDYLPLMALKRSCDYWWTTQNITNNGKQSRNKLVRKNRNAEVE
jgi:hypothetical protein